MKTDYVPLSRNPTRFLKNIDSEPPSLDSTNQLEAQNARGFSILERRPAVASSNFRRVMDSADGSYTLILRLESLKILDHPLITQEFRLAKNIESLIETWEERRRIKIVPFLSNKLEVCIFIILITSY